jgi:hypothetical protein
MAGSHRKPLAFVPHVAAAALVGAVALAWVGCGGAPGLQANVYRGEGFAFRVGEVPAGWERIRVSDAALAWRDRNDDGTVLVNARCDRDDDVPLAALTQHLFLRFTEREVTTEEVVPFDGREAQHTVLTAKLDGVPKRFSVWVLKKDGCVYDLVYVADPARFDRGAPAFETFARAFQALPREDG